MSESIKNDTAKSRAEEWLRLFREQARASNKTVITLAVSLLIGWITVIEATFIDFSNVVQGYETSTQIGRSKEIILDRISRREALVSVATARPRSAAIASDPSEGETSAGVPTGATPEERAELVLLNASLDETRATVAKLKENATFEVLGTKVPIPKAFVVIAWSAIFVSLLAYISIRRRMLSEMLLQAKLERQSSTEQGLDPGSQLYGFAGEAPFWLAPTTSLGFPEPESADHITMALGWGNHKLAWAVSVLAFVALLAVQIRVFGIGLLLTDDYEPAVTAAQALGAQGLEPGPLKYLSDGVLTLLFIAALALAALWLIPHGPTRGIKFNPRRRVALGGGGVALLAGLMFAGRGVVNWKDNITRPGTAKLASEKAIRPVVDAVDPAPKPTIVVDEGFYVETAQSLRSNRDVDGQPLIYYADGKGGGSLRPANDPQAFKKLEPAADIQLPELVRRLEPTRRGWSIEQATLRALPQRADLSLALLRAAVAQDIKTPMAGGRLSLRLYDLLAVVHVMQGQPAHTILQAAGVLDPVATLPQPLKDRVQHWTRPGGAWQQRIAAASTVYKWKVPVPGSKVPIDFEIPRA